MSDPSKGGPEQRERMKSALLKALADGAATVDVADSDNELRRQAALAARQSQWGAQERALAAVGRKLADPREDSRELMNDIDDLRQQIFDTEAEINALKASDSIKFPSASDVANVSAAVGVLDARVAASAAASAIMAAAADLQNAWPL